MPLSTMCDVVNGSSAIALVQVIARVSVVTLTLPGHIITERRTSLSEYSVVISVCHSRQAGESVCICEVVVIVRRSPVESSWFMDMNLVLVRHR